MTGRLSGRVALVTGGSRGIGRGIARRLAAEGAAVAVNYRRDADAAAATVELIREDGGTAAAFAAAVEDPEQNMAKAALEALAATLALEERGNGIRVNVVAPGLVATDMGDRLAKARTGVAAATDLDDRHPLGQVCRPEDVADVVAFLVTTPFVVGERIMIDGGDALARR